MAEKRTIEEKELKEGAKLFERFWLLPKRYADQTAMMRLRINKKWGGWKLKDELIYSLHLDIGNTISTEITTYFTYNIIDDDNDTDLFASADAADWLLENNVGIGTIVDCSVRFAYTKVPVGFNGKDIYKVSLVMVEGFSVVGVDQKYVEESDENSNHISDLFRSFLQS